MPQNLLNLFMETYHRATYARMHPAYTRKGDYLYRLDALSRAQEGGCDDVGMGALFGLYDWRFEALLGWRHSGFSADVSTGAAQSAERREQEFLCVAGVS